MESSNSCGWLRATKLMVWILLSSSCFTSTNQEEITPGCYVRTKRMELGRREHCIPEWTEVKYCTGYCKSVAYPSSVDNTITNPNQNITSVAECCKIKNSVTRSISLTCIPDYDYDNNDNDDNKLFSLEEPTSCECSHCAHT